MAFKEKILHLKDKAHAAFVARFTKPRYFPVTEVPTRFFSLETIIEELGDNSININDIQSAPYARGVERILRAYNKNQHLLPKQIWEVYLRGFESGPFNRGKLVFESGRKLTHQEILNARKWRYRLLTGLNYEESIRLTAGLREIGESIGNYVASIRSWHDAKEAWLTACKYTWLTAAEIWKAGEEDLRYKFSYASSLFASLKDKSLIEMYRIVMQEQPKSCQPPATKFDEIIYYEQLTWYGSAEQYFQPLFSINIFAQEHRKDGIIQVVDVKIDNPTHHQCHIKWFTPTITLKLSGRQYAILSLSRQSS